MSSGTYRMVHKFQITLPIRDNTVKINVLLSHLQFPLIESISTSLVLCNCLPTSLLLNPLLKFLLCSSILSSKTSSAYLWEKQCELASFYLLPKIHKKLVNVPGRPVISNCGTDTQQIWEFNDFHFQPLVSYHVIKDTTDFLENMRFKWYSRKCHSLHYGCCGDVPPETFENFQLIFAQYK